ncbi:MAG: diacylglycerol kinase family lipid kinase [Proteobacteria bacterium]|nr:diacylglycerol kinase family lipid kinase [Pseudomonadota bacterium]
MQINPARTVVIANPTAGDGRVGRNFERLSAQIRKELGDVKVVKTERPGHGIQLAQKAVWDGADLLISLGGDGTHSEVVAGVFKDKDAQRRVTVGLLPCGSGGDFRRLLDASRDIGAHLALIKAREPHMIDVGVAHYLDEENIERSRIFLNECSVGMSATVCDNLNRSRKRFGAASYFAASVSAQLAHRPPLVRIRVDGQEVGDFLANTVMISNGQYAGGGMRFAPRARLTDGMLDVTVIKHANVMRMSLFSPTLYLGGPEDGGLVSTFRGFEVAVEVLTEGDAGVEADGELLGSTPLRAHVVPSGIRLLGVREDAL